MLGASFLATAIKEIKRHDADRRRALSLTDLLGRGLKPDGNISQDHQRLLFELQELVTHAQLKQSELICPECTKAMVVLTLREVEIDYCVACRSSWFDHDELKQFTGQIADVPGIRLTSRRGQLACPRCHNIRMREYQFDRLHNLMVDCCPCCHGVYLQDQELERSLAISDQHQH